MVARSLLIALFLLASGYCEEVAFVDPGLKLAIQRTLGATSEVITRADMETLTQLYAEEHSIETLAGLEFATNLQVLDLGDNNLTDLSSLAGLTQLTELRVHGNKVADLSPLSKLTSLTKLDLWGNNEVIELEPLRALTALRTLSLGYNRIRSTEPLAELADLEELNISNNPIVDLRLPPSEKMKRLHAEGLQMDDLSPFRYPNLEVLDVSFNGFRNIEAFGDFLQLRELRLAHNRIDDLDEIWPFEHLEVLDLSHNHVTTLRGLDQLVTLKSLMLAYSAVTDLSSIRSLKNLGSIRLWNAPLSNIDILLELPGLREASLTGMFLDLTPGAPAMDVIDALRSNGVLVAATGQRPVEAVNFPDAQLDAYFRGIFAGGGQPVTTQNLASLVEMKLRKEGVRNLSGLEHAINLRSLDLRSNHIEDLMPISELRGLTKLTLTKNRLSDVSALSRLTKLRSLELDENEITDLFPLINLFRLEFIDLSENRLTDLGPLSGKQANVVVDRNFLLAASGTQNRVVIDSFLENDLNVLFEPQIPSEPVAVAFEVSGQTCTTTWQAEPGAFYAVLTSEDLIGWHGGSLLEGSNTPMSFTLSWRPPALPRQFVRVVKYVE